MKKSLLFLTAIVFTFSVSAQDCYKKFEDAFAKRGSYTVADDMHRNVIISYFEKEGTTCVSGKARVENGLIMSIFIQYDDNMTTAANATTARTTIDRFIILMNHHQSTRT